MHTLNPSASAEGLSAVRTKEVEMGRKSLNSRRFRGLVLLGATLSILVGGASIAAATSRGPIPDVDSLGPLTMYDHSGKVVSGGSLNVPVSSEIARVTAPGPAPVGFRDGVLLSIWTPVDGTDSSLWNGEAMQGKVDDALSKAQQPLPLVATHFADNTWALAIKAGGGTSKGRYANEYQLRLQGIKYGPQLASRYYTATIQVDPATSDWKLVTGAGSGTPIAPIAGGIGGAVVLLGAGLWWQRRRRSSSGRRSPVSQSPVEVTDSDLTSVH
jgi:hypothetical protein